MTNLFSRLRSHMKVDGHAYPGGRYISMLLKEVLTDVPDFAYEIFPNLPKTIPYRVELEFPYKSKRRADLAFLHADPASKQPLLALMEVKYEDGKNEGVGKQLLDYTAFSTKNKLPFLLLDKYRPSNATIKILEASKQKCSFLSYAELYRKAVRYKGKFKDHPTLRLFCDFLLEETPVFNDAKIDDSAVKMLLINMLTLPHRHGFGRANTRTNGLQSIAALHQLVQNVLVTAEEFHAVFGRDVFGKKPLIQYNPWPNFNLSKTKNEINNGVSGLPRDTRVDGELYIRADYTIPNGAYLSNGIVVGLSKQKAKDVPLYCKAYASFWPNNFVNDVYKKISLSSCANQEKLLNALTSTSAALIEKCMNAEGLPDEHKTYLRKLQRNLK